MKSDHRRRIERLEEIVALRGPTFYRQPVPRPKPVEVETAESKELAERAYVWETFMNFPMGRAYEWENDGRGGPVPETWEKEGKVSRLQWWAAMYPEDAYPEAWAEEDRQQEADEAARITEGDRFLKGLEERERRRKEEQEAWRRKWLGARASSKRRR
jgi:hypothetical protein